MTQHCPGRCLQRRQAGVITLIRTPENSLQGERSLGRRSYKYCRHPDSSSLGGQRGCAGPGRSEGGDGGPGRQAEGECELSQQPRLPDRGQAALVHGDHLQGAVNVKLEVHIKVQVKSKVTGQIIFSTDQGLNHKIKTKH